METAKLKKLLEAWKELRAKEEAILEEIERLAGGGIGIGALMKQGYAAFAEAWASRYSGGYAFNFKKDAQLMKRLVQTVGVDQLTVRASLYIRDSEPFLTGLRHPFGVFAAQVNRYAGVESALEALELESAPADCRHRPPCAD